MTKDEKMSQSMNSRYAIAADHEDYIDRQSWNTSEDGVTVMMAHAKKCFVYVSDLGYVPVTKTALRTKIAEYIHSVNAYSFDCYMQEGNLYYN